jgi:hypothetical protein
MQVRKQADGAGMAFWPRTQGWNFDLTKEQIRLDKRNPHRSSYLETVAKDLIFDVSGVG